MGRIRKSHVDQDRYLTRREGVYYYKRRVPAEMVDADHRGEHVRISLKTSDLARARAMRDIYEMADDEFWSALAGGQEQDGARRRYQAAVKRANALGFFYRPSQEILRDDIDTILQRIEAIGSPQTALPVVRATLGMVDQPDVLLSDAFSVYKDEIVPHELAGKSAGQKKRWTNGKQLSVDSFIEVVGDLPIGNISRDDARVYYDHWMARIAPKKGAATHSASSGNRRIGDLRVLYRDYYRHMGEPDRRNPFDKMSFREKTKRKRKRPSFPHEWIVDTILKSGKLKRLNDQARGVALVVADIGARPSEICNLTADRIVLDHDIPHLKIEPRDDPDDPREIKTESSIRIVPLTGLALAVMKKHPHGFPKYMDKESNLSAALNKFFRENGLFPPGGRHTIYSFRHAFEDRMKEARIDSELRRILMGHTVDRPEYGEGGSLKLRLEEVSKVSLPFDTSIV
ncbi:integrase [Rhizobium sp. ACO-34A]|nr:DUF6538 domain-containing protein [Rhizobium sp. ACO-34A]ATN32859.1 integrase [Rhizobium sp. ACO-34A]